MDQDSLKERIVRAACRDGERLTLSCEQGHRLAEALGVDVRRVGAICQAAGIKIVDCQLGCFGGRRHG